MCLSADKYFALFNDLKLISGCDISTHTCTDQVLALKIKTTVLNSDRMLWYEEKVPQVKGHLERQKHVSQ